MFPRNEHLRRNRLRRAITLIELTIAIAVLALVTAALGALSQAVKVSSGYTEGLSTATQHGRVALERVAAAVTSSFANEVFPGAVVFAETLGSYDYPDTLLVWRPSGTPANPTGLPKFSEIVVFCPNPSAAGELLEITSPSDARSVPATTDLAAWSTELANLKTGSASKKVLLTDLLRTAAPTTSPTTRRGVVRFAVELRPSAAAWASYRAATMAFENVPWVQTIYGSKTGLRQTWVCSELQLRPGYDVADASETTAVPFFGSAACYWNLRQ